MGTPSDLYLRTAETVRMHLSQSGASASTDTPTSIVVRAMDDTGYDVELSDDGREVVVTGGPYHEHFDEAEEAAACFMWMLTPRYRIVALYREKMIVGARLEDSEGNVLGQMKVLLPVFGRKTTQTLVNHHLPADDPRS